MLCISNLRQKRTGFRNNKRNRFGEVSMTMETRIQAAYKRPYVFAHLNDITEPYDNQFFMLQHFTPTGKYEYKAMHI